MDTTSASVRGNATRSGARSGTPCSARTTSRYALPLVCAARSAGSAEHNAARLPGAVIRDAGSDGISGTGNGVSGRPGSSAPSCTHSLSGSARSVDPQPHHDLDVMPRP